jgi:hypothetical protein
MSDENVQPTREVTEFVAEHAPELDPAEVTAFMRKHDKPDDERGSHVAWACRVMREREEGQVGGGLPVQRVVNEMRRLGDDSPRG